MWTTVGAFLLVLVSAWPLRAEPLDPEPVIQTQENFDLGKVSLSLFIVRWLLTATFESLGLILDPAVHGEMVPGGGGFHVSSLHEAQEQKPRNGPSGAATCCT